MSFLTVFWYSSTFFNLLKTELAWSLLFHAHPFFFECPFLMIIQRSCQIIISPLFQICFNESEILTLIKQRKDHSLFHVSSCIVRMVLTSCKTINVWFIVICTLVHIVGDEPVRHMAICQKRYILVLFMRSCFSYQIDWLEKGHWMILCWAWRQKT